MADNFLPVNPEDLPQTTETSGISLPTVVGNSLMTVPVSAIAAAAAGKMSLSTEDGNVYIEIAEG